MSHALVCTLCEGSYWHGVAVLVNSLHAHGYRGTVHVGYRGERPAWFDAALGAAGAGAPRVECVPVDTRRHLTNYKPEFMLSLVGQAKRADASGLVYADPDIVNKCDWSFYERWIALGVALCEDVNSPLDARHPLRQEWREYFGLPPAPRAESQPYFNGGFVGVSWADLAFLERWRDLQATAAARGIDLDGWNHGSRDYLFNKTDQDFLNVAAMIHVDRIAPVGKEGMDFVPGGTLMSHAIGSMKPWNTSYLGRVMRGWRPRIVDHEYWRMARAPLSAHPAGEAWRARVAVKIAAALGRVLAKA